MTTLEIILTAIIWVGYGVFNASQHDFHEDVKGDGQGFFIFINIALSPIAFVIRFFRGMFYWKGKY